MGLLSAEAQAELVQQLGGETVEAPEVEEQLEAEESEASAEIEEPEGEDYEEEEVLEADSAEESVEEEEYDPEAGHRVPYNRFKQINDRRKQLEDEMATRDRMIEEMKAKLNTRHAPKAEPEPSGDWDYDPEHEEVADPDGWAAQMKQVKDSNERLQIKFARMELDREIAEARESFPSVPEGYLWDSVAKDGSVSVLEAAQRYSTFVAEIEEAAIARHLGEMGDMEKAGKASAPPRPKSRGVAASSTRDAPPPENMDAARDAMLQYLRS